jgi:hypothetical protein
MLLSPANIWRLKARFCHRSITLKSGAKPIQQCCCRQPNPNYVEKVKEEIDKLLGAGFIWPVKMATWLASIVIVPSSIAQTVIDAVQLPFITAILDTVAVA